MGGKSLRTECTKCSSAKNDLRTQAYELTPYDETIMLDSDYIIANDVLKHCFTQDHNFLIYKDAKDLTGFRDTTEFERISETSINFYWANKQASNQTNNKHSQHQRNVCISFLRFP